MPNQFGVRNYQFLRESFSVPLELIVPKPWKSAAELILMEPTTASVVTTAQLRLIGDAKHPAARVPDATFHRWVRDLATSGKLMQVSKGVYLNRLGHRTAVPVAAVEYIRRGAVVSLSWILEQAGLTNNFGETYTCIVPTDATWSKAQTATRPIAGLGTFRFHTMRYDLVVPRDARDDDIFDYRFDYRRATPEKALLDWLYLAQSHRSHMQLPPMDIALEQMDKRRLNRLLKISRPEVTRAFAAWTAERKKYQEDPDVTANSASLRPDL